jgi:hypothetical protein
MDTKQGNDTNLIVQASTILWSPPSHAVPNTRQAQPRSIPDS